MAPGPLNVLLLGPQGAGKGTQAKRIASEYDLAHIATGDILREEVARESQLGRKVKSILERGELVSDETMIELIRNRLGEDDTTGGFVLDGFPRTLPQSEALDDLLDELRLPLSIVFELQVTAEVSRERMRKRAADEGRSDDSPEAIERRLELYCRETAPIVQRYRARGNLVGIHGDRPIDEVFAEIQTALDQAAERETVT